LICINNSQGPDGNLLATIDSGVDEKRAPDKVYGALRDISGSLGENGRFAVGPEKQCSADQAQEYQRDQKLKTDA
jgi:hypothetical protein